MKYSIRPHHIHKSKRFIFQDGIQAFSPDDAHLEFWARIQELEKLCAEKEDRINKLVFEIATWGETLKKNK
jgi:hypothetical protein